MVGLVIRAKWEKSLTGRVVTGLVEKLFLEGGREAWKEAAAVIMPQPSFPPRHPHRSAWPGT